MPQRGRQKFASVKANRKSQEVMGIGSENGGASA